MKGIKLDRRGLVVAGSALLLAGCKIIPTSPDSTPGPIATPTPEPSATSLPTDSKRHRVALLLPMSGPNAEVGESIANATTMALLDTNADNLRITTYDTSKGARAAAAKAVADGNKLILGPLLSDNVPQVLAEARPANVPLITYSNDARVASPDVFVMGIVPSQMVDRTVKFARQHGSVNFAAVLPEGEYGNRLQSALASAVRASGGQLVATERYARGNSSIIGAAQRLRDRGGYDTVLLGDGARLSAMAANVFRPDGTGNTQILGNELWSGESSVVNVPALRGAWFSAVSDERFKRFSDSYKTRFGGMPYRIATLGYDSVLLTLRIGREWKPGSSFPTARLYDRGGFLGVDGPFRFQRNGVVERALEVREVRDGQVVIVSYAPKSFTD